MDFKERKKQLRQENILTQAGKMPPSAIEMEEWVIGSILTNSTYLIDIEDSLRPDHFYKDDNKTIYQAIVNLSRRSLPIDISTISNELRSMGKLESSGGMYRLIELERGGLKGNVSYHSRIILQKYMQRQIIINASETIAKAYDDTVDVFDLIEEHDNAIFNITKETHSKQSETMGNLTNQVIEELGIVPESGLTGVGSGLTKLDHLTNGWQPGNLIIVAARPAMGKTAFVLNCARNASIDFDKPVAIFSLEMTSPELTKRMLANEANIPLTRILKKQITTNEIPELREKAKKLIEAKMTIDDTAGLNIFEFRAKCRRLKSMYDIQMIVVDYLQLMHAGDGSNRDNEIGKITGALKAVAKELNVPVIALSQLSRQVDGRPSKRPILSDLRESGNIEQDADMVLFLYRPEYYGMLVDEKGNSNIGLSELIVAKNRNGICDYINLDFNGSKMRFKDWVEAYDKPTPPKDLIPTQNQIEFTAPNPDYEEDTPF